MSAPVTGFPFSVVSHPMYTGVTAVFFGYAIKRRSPTGIALATLVGVAYAVAVHFFETPFTNQIYSKKNSAND